MAKASVVMKFGGTSVGDANAILRVCEIVRGRLPQRPVVVVSAMAKVTDQLLDMGRAAGCGDRKTALTLARELRERHYNTAGELLGTALFTQFHSDLGTEFEALDELLRGISAVGELTPRTTDHVASFGELLSSKLVAAAILCAMGSKPVLVDSRKLHRHRRRVYPRRTVSLRRQMRGWTKLISLWWKRACAGDGWIHRFDPRREYHHHRAGRIGFLCGDRRRRTERGANRNLDRRRRHDDHRSKHLS